MPASTFHNYTLTSIILGTLHVISVALLCILTFSAQSNYKYLFSFLDALPLLRYASALDLYDPASSNCMVLSINLQCSDGGLASPCKSLRQGQESIALDPAQWLYMGDLKGGVTTSLLKDIYSTCLIAYACTHRTPRTSHPYLRRSFSQ
jgi:hypothetical protein